jgi:predicted HicB family RNase H-like nuclease
MKQESFVPGAGGTELFDSKAFDTGAFECMGIPSFRASDTFDPAIEFFDSGAVDPGAFERMDIPSFRASDTFDPAPELFDFEAVDLRAFDSVEIPGFRASDTFDPAPELFDFEAVDLRAFDCVDIPSFRGSDTFDLATIALYTPRLAFLCFFAINPTMLFLLPVKAVTPSVTPLVALFVGACNSFVTR